jgi:hypothetical protein
MRDDVVEQERCAALRKERGSAAPRLLCASDAIWSSTNTLLQRETRRNAWLFGYEGQSALRFDPPGPRRARGVCLYNLTDIKVWPPPPYTLVFNIMLSKKFLTFCLPSCNNKL